MDQTDSISQFERRRRHLPHWEEPGATYFLTLCVKRGVEIDLTWPALARLVIDALRHFDDDHYWLYDYTIMPDHVHVILKPIVREARTKHLWRILQSLKAWTARRINEQLARFGPVWQDETYDHIIRDRHDYENAAGYIYQNPCTDGLVADPADWPWWGKGSGP
jgi:REP element-mobilizing transposase RayT